ncbi:MAG: ferritin family protein [candidate division KSB1 bacterium]|nr:ferritin family protein [candidate division KSB1 bacterium]
MSGSDVSLVVNEAIQIEINGLDSYLRFASRTRHLTGKNMFIRLAKDELEHLRLFEKLRPKLLAGQPASTQEAEVRPISFVRPQLRKVDRVTKGEEHADELTALEAALELERKSIEFYGRWAEDVADPELRKLLLSLKEVEESHFDLLQAEMDSLTGTGFWFGVPEFDLEAG